MFRIRIDLNTDLDPDPAFQVNTDSDLDPGFFMTKMEENSFFAKRFLQSLIALKMLRLLVPSSGFPKCLSKSLMGRGSSIPPFLKGRGRGSSTPPVAREGYCNAVGTK